MKPRCSGSIAKPTWVVRPDRRAGLRRMAAILLIGEIGERDRAASALGALKGVLASSRAAASTRIGVEGIGGHRLGRGRADISAGLVAARAPAKASFRKSRRAGHSSYSLAIASTLPRGSRTSRNWSYLSSGHSKPLIESARREADPACRRSNLSVILAKRSLLARAVRIFSESLGQGLTQAETSTAGYADRNEPP